MSGKLTWTQLCAAIQYASNNGIEIPGLDASRLTEKDLTEANPIVAPLVDRAVAFLARREAPKLVKTGRKNKPSAAEKLFAEIQSKAIPAPSLSDRLLGHIFSDEALDVLQVMHELGANVNRSRVLTHRSLKGLSTAKWDSARRELKRLGTITQHGTRNFAGYTLTPLGLDVYRANYT